MFLYRNQSRPITRLPLLILRDLVLCPAQGGNVADRYRNTPVTYTATIYLLYRFLSCLVYAVQRLVNAGEDVLSGTSQVAVPDE